MSVIVFIAAVLVCQLLGEVVVLVLGLPFPGPVIGMALLFAALCLRGGVPGEVQDVLTPLLRHLSLLFVPAGVGVVAHLDLLGDAWAGIVLAVLASTAVALAAGGLVMQALCGRDTLQASEEEGA